MEKMFRLPAVRIEVGLHEKMKKYGELTGSNTTNTVRLALAQFLEMRLPKNEKKR